MKTKEDPNKPFVYEDWVKSGKKPRAQKGWGPKGFSTRLMESFAEEDKKRSNKM